MSVKLFALVLVFYVSFVIAGPAKISNYIEQENSCRKVCGLCDCDGFYCEDECICECNLENDENLQCIADMEKECDANGLEYELLMQDATKERFMRQVKGNPMDFAKHLVILKQKRQSASSTTEPTVAAPAPAPESETNPDEEQVGAEEPPKEEAADGPVVGNPLAAITSFGGKAAIAGKTAFAALTAPKILVTLRERLANLNPAPSRAPIVLPRLATTAAPPQPRFSFPPFPTLRPLVVQPSGLF